MITSTMGTCLYGACFAAGLFSQGVWVPFLQPMSQLLDMQGRASWRDGLATQNTCWWPQTVRGHDSPEPSDEVRDLTTWISWDLRRRKKPLVNRLVLSCPVLQAGGEAAGQWFCELPGQPTECADHVKVQGGAKAFSSPLWKLVCK